MWKGVVVLISNLRSCLESCLRPCPSCPPSHDVHWRGIKQTTVLWGAVVDWFQPRVKSSQLPQRSRFVSEKLPNADLFFRFRPVMVMMEILGKYSLPCFGVRVVFVVGLRFQHISYVSGMRTPRNPHAHPRNTHTTPTQHPRTTHATLTQCRRDGIREIF